METARRINVAWSVAEICYPLMDAAQVLSTFGFAAVPLPASDYGSSKAEVAVLHSRCFPGLGALRQVCDGLSRPSLIVVGSQAEESEVLRWPDLPLTVDICRAEALREQLPDRLRRLATAVDGGIAWNPGPQTGRAVQKHVYRREYLNDRLAREFANAQKQCRSLSLVWLRVGDYGGISQKFGNSAATRVLKAIARVILSNIRVVDWLAQYEKDEFCLVMPDTWLEEGTRVAERIVNGLHSLDVPIDEHNTLTPRINLGIAELTDDEKSFEDLLQKAAESVLVRTISG